MAANLASRRIQLTIGGMDWSAHLSSMTAGYSSLSIDGAAGIITVSGQITINKNWNNPESLSPRLNPTRWRPGQIISALCRNAADDAWISGWFSQLIILEEPPEPGSSGQLTLSVGCKLTWADLYQLDDDRSGIELGNAENCSTVAARLLEASEVAPANISLNTWPYANDRPFGKVGRSFASQAGELAWSNDGRALYQDVSGVVTDKQVLTLPTVAIATVTLGTDDRLWQPLADPQQPTEVTKCAGIGYVLTADSTPDVVTDEVTADLGDYIPGAVGTGIVHRTTTTRSFSTGDAMTASTKTVRTLVEELPATIFQYPASVSPATSVLTFTDTTEVSTYEIVADPVGRAKLETVVTTKLQRGMSIDPSDVLSNIRTVERTTKDFSYVDEVASTVSTVLEKAEILLDETSNNPWNVRQVESEVNTWVSKGGGVYERKEVRSIARVATSSTIDKTRQNIWAPQVTSRTYTATLSNSPPSTDLYDAAIAEDEKHYIGTATYTHRGGATGRTRERLFTIPFGFSDTQMETMAVLCRDILVGRHLGDEIELVLTDALLTTPPLPEIHVLDDGTTYKYLGDALSVEFLADRMTGHCVGIWLDGGY